MVAFYLPNFLLLLSGFAFLGAAYTLPHTIRQMDEWRNSTMNNARQQQNGTRRGKHRIIIFFTQK
jgi:hypothetical protein